MPASLEHKRRVLEHLERIAHAMRDEDVRMVVCSYCDGEGMIEYNTGCYCSETGAELTNQEMCDYCGGSGDEEMRTILADMDMEP